MLNRFLNWWKRNRRHRRFKRELAGLRALPAVCAAKVMIERGWVVSAGRHHRLKANVNNMARLIVETRFGRR